MSEPKPLASLSSGLLARKGQAAPAMRRQGQGLAGMIRTSQPTEPSTEFDDLGWNDMGEEAEYLPGKAGLSPMAPSPISPAVVPLAMAASAPVEPITQDVTPQQPEPPAVVLQQQELEREIVAQQPTPVAPTAPAPPLMMISPAPTVPTRAAPGSRGKAAFTLRLDAERHLKLRLVCAVSHRSAQQVVTDALDAFLASQPLPADLSGVTAR